MRKSPPPPKYGLRTLFYIELKSLASRCECNYTNVLRPNPNQAYVKEGFQDEITESPTFYHLCIMQGWSEGRSEDGSRGGQRRADRGIRSADPQAEL